MCVAAADDNICYGHGSHFTFELLKHCQEIGLHILLRPPHTTHVLQDEDVVNFAVFKSHHQKTKQMALASKILHGEGAQLSPADLLLCARDAWQNAFSKANFLKAWADTGLVPFTRKVYLDLLEDEERKETRYQVAPCPAKFVYLYIININCQYIYIYLFVFSYAIGCAIG